MKKIAVSSLVSLLFLSCSVPVANNGRIPHRDFRWSQYAPTGHQTPLLEGAGVGSPHSSLNFADLEKEYKSFSTKALSDAYVKRMFGKYLAPVNSVQLTRQLEFSRYLKNNGDTSYETSLKSMFAQTPSLYDTMTGASAPDIQNKITSDSANFGAYVIGLSPYPGTPVATTATSITSSSFTANWNTTTNATGYKLYVNGSQVYSGTDTTFNVTGLTANSTYNYYVKAINNAGESQSSNTISATLTVNAPGVPVATAATGITQTSFTANWNTVSGATGYKLIVDNGTPIDTGLVTSYSLSGLTAGATHTYYLQAINEGGTSSNSNTISVPVGLTAPVAKIASSVTATSFRANWNSVSGATSYKLFIDGVEAYTGSALYYNKSGVASGSTHTYYVQALNSNNTSPYSNEISVSLLTHLTEIQSISTGYFTYDAESFTIGTDTYIAFANHCYGHSSAYTTMDSNIYKWDTSTGQLILIQGIQTYGAYNLKFFTIGSNNYLAISNFYSDSKLYKWNTSTKQFAEIQTITSAQGVNINHFSIGTSHYLTVANYGYYSKIYKWNGSQFIELQELSTGKPNNNLKPFTIGTDNYVAISDSSAGNTEIYKWNTSINKFDTTPTQIISSLPALPIGSEVFSTGVDYYIAISNDSTTKIYKWNTSTNKFTTTSAINSFTSSSTFTSKHFTVGSDHYLAIPNASTNSEIYKWNGSSFSLFQTVESGSAVSWDSFVIGTKTYLAIAANYSNSKIHRLD